MWLELVKSKFILQFGDPWYEYKCGVNMQQPINSISQVVKKCHM